MSDLMNSINNNFAEETTVTEETKAKAALNAVYGVTAENYVDTDTVDPYHSITDKSMNQMYPETQLIETQQDRDVQAIINGDVTNSFTVLASSGDFTAREAYRLTRPDDDEAISIGRQCKNVVIDFDRYLIYAYELEGGKMGVGITIIGTDGKKYVTSGTAFIKEFLLLVRIYAQDGEKLTKIKVLHKESKNKTADGQKMFYALPVGM